MKTRRNLILTAFALAALAGSIWWAARRATSLLELATDDPTDLDVNVVDDEVPQ